MSTEDCLNVCSTVALCTHCISTMLDKSALTALHENIDSLACGRKSSLPCVSTLCLPKLKNFDTIVKVKC